MFWTAQYINKMIEQFEKMFGTKPVEYTSGDHPEIDTDELDAKGIKMYQSMIGCLQLEISLGQFDIHTATLTMSHFSTAPCQRHLECLKWMYGYLKKFKSNAIRGRTEVPYFSELTNQDFGWCQTAYANVTEKVPRGILNLLGKAVIFW
jgi:hypothetical protein